MGYAARANPRSTDGHTPERDALMARLARFAESFATRDALDAYVAQTSLNEAEQATLDQVLPERLRVTAP